MSRWVGLVLAVVGIFWTGTGLAQPVASASRVAPSGSAPVPAATAISSASPAKTATRPSKAEAPAAPADPVLQALQKKRDDLRALLLGKLDIAIDPQSLFAVALDDPKAIAIERLRLRSVLNAEEVRSKSLLADGGAGAGGSSDDDSGKDDPAKKKAGSRPTGSNAPTAKPPSTTPAEGEKGAGTPPGKVPAGSAPAAVDPIRWQAQLEVDRLTLQFLDLDPKERAAKLRVHREAKEQAGQQARQEREAREKRIQAEKSRLAAIAAEKAAKDAISRLLSGERRKLADAELAISKVGEKRAAESREMVRNAQSLLEIEQACGQLIKRRQGRQATALEADQLYDEVVGQLHLTQQTLETLLDDWDRAGKNVAALPPSELAKLANQLEPPFLERRRAIESKRRSLQLMVAKERREEKLHHKSRVAASADRARRLNRSRLSLLPFLSDKKQNALSSLDSPGRNQAGSELAQIVLVLRYHAAASARWLQSLGQEHGTTNRKRLYWTLSQWLLAIAFFVWWRRRADRWLEVWAQRLAEQRKRSQRRHQGVRLLRRVRAPAEWLLLFYALQRMLPSGSQQVLEVTLAGSIIAWMVGESLVVEGIDALASQRRKKNQPNAELRLRSLRFIGRIVVVFGLTLSLSRQLVGEGTIYSWIATLCWWAPLPMSFLLVRWWQQQIFVRINLRKRHTTLTAWIVAHEEDWLRLLAAFVGGIYLTLRATNRVARHWLSQSNFSRRILAYWFRREVSRKEQEEQQQLALKPLPPAIFEKLHPAGPSDVFIPGVADEQLARIIERVRAPGGGVFAIVGERGAGKSTLLRQILQGAQCDLVHCPAGGATPFLASLRGTLKVDQDADFEQLQETINSRSSQSGILVDDAHHLIRPVIGGLDDFDRILELARNSSIKTCTWVFCIDRVIWQFFKRARGAKPIFDDVVVLKPWPEDKITQMLRSHGEQAGIAPKFDLLLGDLPEDADELDRNDAYSRVETNTYRWLWDYSNGNPAVALEFWRESLFVDSEDNTQVRLVPTPDVSDIERLSDDAIFVLRAVIQLDLASPADVAEATLLSTAQVANALRYAESRGYVEVIDGRYHVCWPWLRAITNVLERRHLLVGTSA